MDDYGAVMSTAELIERVRALPPRERQKILSAVLTFEEAETARPHPRTKRLAWPDVEVRAKRIFGDRVLPNLVLAGREQSTF